VALSLSIVPPFNLALVRKIEKALSDIIEEKTFYTR
jgi:hypothetical protein